MVTGIELFLSVEATLHDNTVVREVADGGSRWRVMPLLPRTEVEVLTEVRARLAERIRCSRWTTQLHRINGRMWIHISTMPMGSTFPRHSTGPVAANHLLQNERRYTHITEYGRERRTGAKPLLYLIFKMFN